MTVPDLGKHDPDFDRLLSDLCDGTLGEADMAALGRRIADDPAARRRYLQYVDLHANLGGEVVMPAIPVAPAATAQPRARSTALLRMRPWIAGMSAACAALATWFALRGRPEPAPTRDPEPVQAAAPARLAEVSGEAELRRPGGESVEAAAGSLVAPGQTVRVVSDVGFAALQFDDGARLELNSEGQVRWADDPSGPRRLVLSAGVMRGDATHRDGGRPMVVVTPQAEIHSDGRFTVSAPTPDTTEVQAESGSVRMVRVSDGRTTIVPAGHYAVMISGIPEIEVRSAPVELSQPRAKFKFSGVRSLAFSADGRTLTAVSHAEWTVWDLAAGNPLFAPVRFGDNAERAALSADGRRIIHCGRDGRARLFDALAGREAGGFATGYNQNWLWVLSADGSRAAAAHFVSGPPGTARVWTLGDAPPTEHPAMKMENPARCLALSADGRLAAYGVDRISKSAPGSRLAVWDTATGWRTGAIVPESPLRVLAFSPDGRRIAGASENGALGIWDPANAEWIGGRSAADGWTRPIRSLAFSPDGRRLAAGTADGRVRIIDADGGREVVVLNCGPRAVSALAFSPDGRTLAVGALGPITLWDVPIDPLRPAAAL